MPFSKETFAPKNYQNLLSFGQTRKTKNFAKTKTKEEIALILEKEILPILKKWNDFKNNYDYRESIFFSGLFLVLNFFVSVFYLTVFFGILMISIFFLARKDDLIFYENNFTLNFTQEQPQILFSINNSHEIIFVFLLIFALILILLFPRLSSTRAIFRYFKVHKDLFFYNFGDNFKAEIVNKCLFDYPNLAFYPSGKFISQQNVKDSGLFGNFHHFSSQDQISEIPATKLNFKMAEIDLETNSKVFTSLFFVANFPIQDQTYILPKGFRFEIRLQKVILESPIFMKFFEVYSSSQIISRLILQTDIMDRLNNFATNHSQKIHLSFQKNQIFAFIKFPKNLFEA